LVYTTTRITTINRAEASISIPNIRGKGNA
jgi:hypothetical protein